MLTITTKTFSNVNKQLTIITKTFLTWIHMTTWWNCVINCHDGPLARKWDNTNSYDHDSNKFDNSWSKKISSNASTVLSLLPCIQLCQKRTASSAVSQLVVSEKWKPYHQFDWRRGGGIPPPHVYTHFTITARPFSFTR